MSKKSYRHMRAEEPETLSLGLAHGHSLRTMASVLGRTTRLVLLARMEGTDATSAHQGFTKKLRHVPALLRTTLTDDRGNERAEHERLAERLAIRVFFADPTTHGHAAPTRIQIGCCARTCPRARTCRAPPSASSTPWPIG